MMRELAGQVALITGGASGIGLAIARSLAGQGMKIVIADIDATKLEAARMALASDDAIVRASHLDVRDAGAWEHLVRDVEGAFGQISVLCNNAGIGLPAASTEEIALADWRHIIDVNLTSVYLGTHAVLPSMKARGQGHIVNTSSILGLFPKGHHTAYVASKFAVVGFTEALRAELAPHGIGASVLLPGLVQTAQMASAEKRFATATVVRNIAKPAGIMPESVGKVVVHAILNNQLYALSHKEYFCIVSDRSQRIASAFENAALEESGEDIHYLGNDSLSLS